jgi:hypothetical protein
MSKVNGGNMFVVKSSWNEGETFRLIPVTDDCPYVECIFDPATKVFVIISKISKTTLHMLPKLDENGDPSPLKTKRANGRTVKEERKTIETFQEYYIEDVDAIKSLVEFFALNHKDMDWKSFLEVKK